MPTARLPDIISGFITLVKILSIKVCDEFTTLVGRDIRGRSKLLVRSSKNSDISLSLSQFSRL